MRFLLNASAGLLIWAISFSLLYALQGTSCALRWDDIPLGVGTVSDWVLTIVWTLFLALSAFLVRWAKRLPEGLERRLAISSAIIGFTAILITGSPMLITSTCSP